MPKDLYELTKWRIIVQFHCSRSQRLISSNLNIPASTTIYEKSEKLKNPIQTDKPDYLNR